MNQATIDIEEKIAITETITRFMRAVDQKQFELVRSMLTDESKSMVEPWIVNLTPVQAVHHQVGNFEIERAGSAWRARFYGIATWFRPNAQARVTWFVGDYDCVLVKQGNDWRIKELIYNNKFIDPPL